MKIMKTRFALLFPLLFALPAQAFEATLDERPVMSFAEEAMTRMFSHDFANHHESRKNVRSVFASDKNYQDFLGQLDFSFMPLIRDERMVVKPEAMDIREIGKEGDTWQVSGTVDMGWSSIKKHTTEPVSFKMRITETDYGFGVKNIVMVNAGYLK